MLYHSSFSQTNLSWWEIPLPVKPAPYFQQCGRKKRRCRENLPRLCIPGWVLLVVRSNFSVSKIECLIVLWVGDDEQTPFNHCSIFYKKIVTMTKKNHVDSLKCSSYMEQSVLNNQVKQLDDVCFVLQVNTTLMINDRQHPSINSFRGKRILHDSISGKWQ